LVAGIGSLVTGGRWTPPGAFRAVYTSRDEVTALEEARQQNLRLVVPTWMALPLVLTAIEVDLEPVLDLTDGRVRRALRVSRGPDACRTLVAPPGFKSTAFHDGPMTIRPGPRGGVPSRFRRFAPPPEDRQGAPGSQIVAPM
jgi:RES domain-containing protein